MADMADMLKSFSSMMEGKQIPDNIKEMLNSLQNNSAQNGANVGNNTTANTTDSNMNSYVNQANSSETTLVDAIFIPAAERVIPKRYTDIIKLNTPNASSPILLVIYTLNPTPINCKIKVLTKVIKLLITNIFSLFKVHHLKKYMNET